MAPRAAFEMGGLRIPAGRAPTRELPVPSLVTGMHVSLPVRVTHGREPGPTIWISAALPAEVGVSSSRPGSTRRDDTP